MENKYLLPVHILIFTVWLPSYAQQKDTASCQTITVDGLLSEPAWNGTKRQVANVVQGASGGTTAEFKTCFDNNYLYIGARVKDGQLYNQAQNIWENSSLEVFLDLDHSRSTTYDSDDFQYISVWNNASPWEQKGRTSGVLVGCRTDSQATTKATQYGIFCGNTISAVQTYENWLGKHCDGILGNIGMASWSDMDPGWAIGNWSPIDRPVFWSMPLIPNGATLADAAAGNHNAEYKAYATKLAKYRPQDSVLYIRTAWEFNGNWFPWTAIGKEQDFIGAWRQFVNSFRSVSNRFRFDWCPNFGASGMTKVEDAYPGDAYVDIIGLDYYDETTWSKISDPVQRWDSKMNQAYGLAWHRDFAKAHGKPMSFPEWGVGGDGSGDNPYFVQQMYKWFADNKVVYESYWNSNAAYSGQLDNNQYPNAGIEYKKDFGGNNSVITVAGYSMEIAIPWSTLGITPAQGALYGYDIGVNLNHDNGARTGHLMWNGAETNSSNTSQFGDLLINGVCATAVTETNDDTQVDIYPNPLGNENLNIDLTGYTKENVTLTITDISGRIVYSGSRTLNSARHMTIPASALPANGLYFISVQTAASVEIFKLAVNRGY